MMNYKETRVLIYDAAYNACTAKKQHKGKSALRGEEGKRARDSTARGRDGERKHRSSCTEGGRGMRDD